jgi:hypothetical protein
MAPVSLGQPSNEPTVIVVRERPKAAWFFAAVALGALGAIGGSRLLGPHAATAPALAATAPVLAATAPVLAAAAPVLAAAAAEVPAAPPVASSSSSESRDLPPVVMRFGDDQGVAINAMPAAPSVSGSASSARPSPSPGAARPATRSAARPATPSTRLGPALPDGSFGLGGSETPAATKSAAPAPPAPAAPTPRRGLTPAQELAEAQLKASMR